MQELQVGGYLGKKSPVQTGGWRTILLVSRCCDVVQASRSIRRSIRNAGGGRGRVLLVLMGVEEVAAVVVVVVVTATVVLESGRGGAANAPLAVSPSYGI